MSPSDAIGACPLLPTCWGGACSRSAGPAAARTRGRSTPTHRPPRVTSPASWPLSDGGPLGLVAALGADRLGQNLQADADREGHQALWGGAHQPPSASWTLAGSGRSILATA